MLQTDIEFKKSVQASLKELVRQFSIANSLRKVKMCYDFSNSIKDLPADAKDKLLNDFNQAIDMAYDQ